MVGGQLVHDGEGRAVKRHHDDDRPLPGLHVDVKIGRPLEKIRAGEGERVETVRPHHLGHEPATVVESGTGEEHHGVLSYRVSSGLVMPRESGAVGWAKAAVARSAKAGVP